MKFSYSFKNEFFLVRQTPVNVIFLCKLSHFDAISGAVYWLYVYPLHSSLCY